MKRGAAAWLAAALAAAIPAAAQTVKVEAVQYPAWLERGGLRVPLSAGIALRGQDGVVTGSNARVVLRLSEGSTVKLGENAQFTIDRAEQRGGVFRAALSVLAGAFRFTTTQLRKRDVAVKVKNVTAGIRGTDLWGKSTEQRDLVCLIEGRISVGAEGHPTVTLDQPLDFYQLPRGGEPAVARVDEKQIEEWAKETEIPPEGAAARSGGGWAVVAAVVDDRALALRIRRVLRHRGYPAEIVGRDGRFAVEVPGLAGEAEARALRENLRREPGVENPDIRARS